ncbi:MbnP family protein [Flavobacterium sp.]|uniref:MbnP family protein n=1 Tax=Flavobacterium sp. TaxID=239 RepID=UPI00286F50FB|nr:MbnP family protein [Flavobacterium sp.]
MKFQFKYSIAAIAIAFALFSCTDKNDEVITGEGNLKLEFDNVYNANNLAFDTPYTNSNGEVVKINKLKYIVSNIVLTKVDGTTFTVPKSQSYFIVDESTTASTLLNLLNIPAANYTKVSFGIGVDQAQFNLGATGQGDFLALAQTAGMMWSWSAGYKFLAFEGTFTSSTVTSPTSFMVHTGQTGTDYNYTTVTLNLPTNALVRTTITPQVHIMTDISKVLDGTNKVSLTASNGMGMGAMIMSGANLPLITANLSNMFSVEHVHND